MSSYLKNYLESLPAAVSKIEKDDYAVYPVPAESYISVVKSNNLPEEDYSLINYTGQTILTGKLNDEESRVDISALNPGIYLLRTGKEKTQTFKVIKN